MGYRDNEGSLIAIKPAKRVDVRGRELGAGTRPLICAPLIGKNVEIILSELTSVLSKQPDMIEWRADFFAGIAKTAEVDNATKQIRQTAGEIPVIFTIRSSREGGEPISLSEAEIVQVHSAVCRSKSVDIIDFELSNRKENLEDLRKISLANDIKMIMSYHNFEYTPSPAAIKAKIAAAEDLGADIAKVAVMSKSLQDVLTLLNSTLEAKNTGKIPLITMAMGGYGSLTRLVGGIFGSAVTFAVGENSSAPGQVPIEDLKTVLGILQKLIQADTI